MERASTTVIVVVSRSLDGAAGLAGAANVRTLRTDPEAPLLDRAAEAWAQVTRTNATYTVHDGDPLAAVAEAWARRFDGLGPVGELEVAVSETVARWRARSFDLPDYYLLVDPEDWDATLRHWYLGYLAGTAPARVVAAGRNLLGTLGRLATGKWWPDLDRLVAGIDRVVPDRAGRRHAPAGCQYSIASIAAIDPLLEVRRLGPDGGVVTVPGMHDG